MKKLIAILFLTLPVIALGQSYTVIHVIGKIYNTSTKEYLKSSSKLSEDAQLKFETPNARAALLSPSKGRFIIQQKETTQQQSDFTYALASVITPARGKMSSRSGGINNQLDFTNKFAKGPVVWIGNTYKLVVSPTAYPMNETNFFYVSYDYKGEKINKKIGFSGDTLIFTIDQFYAVDERPIDPQKTSNLVLYYYNAADQTATELTSIHFSILPEATLKSLGSSLTGMNKEDKIEALEEIVLSLYGTCSDAELQTAIAIALDE